MIIYKNEDKNFEKYTDYIHSDLIINSEQKPTFNYYMLNKYGRFLYDNDVINTYFYIDNLPSYILYSVEYEDSETILYKFRNTYNIEKDFRYYYVNNEIEWMNY